MDLLIIDPQNDFCDPNGALYVKGADEDMERLAKFILSRLDSIDMIHVTLDTHGLIDIAHPQFWRNSEGEMPQPFTIISFENVVNSIWTTKNDGVRERALEYLKKLEERSCYPLCIWPPHCLIGDWGHNIFPPLKDALMAWESAKFCGPNYHLKGDNPFTEHYSAIQAEVPDADDKNTQMNLQLVRDCINADELLVAGEASSHCVANTVRDLISGVNEIYPLSLPESFLKNMVILEDAMSPVPTFEKLGEDFIDEMRGAGVRVEKIARLLS